jgi:hypothetical protein
VELAIETRISPEAWHDTLQRDPRLITTALAVLADRADQIRKRNR